MRTYAVEYEFGEQRQLALRMPECMFVAGHLRETVGAARTKLCELGTRLERWKQKHGAEIVEFTPRRADAKRLEALHATFQKWFGKTCDTDVLDVTIAARVAHLKCTEDRPPWLFIVGGSGDLKTEIIKCLEHKVSGAGGIIVGSIGSQATLLSGLGQKDRDKDATGGLLLMWPRSCFLLMIDFTTTLALHPHARAGVLDAFRFMFDGRWPRATGGGGGHQEYWEGRIGLVAGVTTAIDEANDSIQKLGSRWALIRTVESEARRLDAGRHAIHNTFSVSEEDMTRELGQAVSSFLNDLPSERDTSLTEEEEEQILLLANLTTRVRSSVDFDYSGRHVISVGALEMPTRFPKVLVQLFRGLVIIGYTRSDAMRLTQRLAGDSVPPMRRRVLEDVAANPNTMPPDVRRRLNTPDFSVRRELEALHALRALDAVDVSVVVGG